MPTFPTATVTLALPDGWAARHPQRGPLTVRFLHTGSGWEAIIHGTLVHRTALRDAIADARGIAYGPAYPLDASGWGGDWTLSPAMLRRSPTL